MDGKPSVSMGSEKKWPKSPMDFNLTANDPEVKGNLRVNAKVVSTNTTSQLINFFSGWQRLKVAVAWIIKLKGALLKPSKKRKGLQLANSSANGAPLNVLKEMQAFRNSLGNQRVSLENLTEAKTAIIAFFQKKDSQRK